MKNLRRVSGMVTTLSLVLSLMGPMTAHAALVPGFLGLTSTYSVFGKTGITGGGASAVWGDVGENGAGDASISGQQAGTYYPLASTPLTDALTAARLALNAETPTGTVDLAAANVAVGPGVYTVTTTAFTKTLTLNGAGTYIFKRPSSNIAQNTGGTMILQGGACASDIYWDVGTDMAFATGTGVNMYGTIIAGTTIAFGGSGLNLKGRALTDTQVTLGGFTINITEPVACATQPSQGTFQASAGTITVVKNVINDNGGTKTGADFPLFMNGVPVVSGATNTFFPAAAYDVTETSNTAQYARSFSGDCDANGRLSLNAGEAKTCIVINNDIGPAVVVPPVPPLIDVVKVPSPLALPNGPGPVTYTYTTRNIGTVPMSNVTMVGDTCSPIVLASGDLNGDAKLDMNETWVYTCSTTLQATHTNTVVATGWANGISAVDIASATVVVGLPIVPPLIHITKVPSPLALRAGGGAVTYTYTVTNPGTAPLSNVGVIDDKCTGLPAQVSGHPGDLNKNNLLESNETWKFTCKSNLTETTTNTATARGEANGMTVRDFAVVTVVVAAAVPVLPKTGFVPTENVIAWGVGAAGLLAVSLLLFVLRKKQNV